MQQYIDLLNLYFSFRKLEFHALLVNRVADGFSLDKWNHDEWKAYASFTRHLLDKSLDRDVFAIVDLQEKPGNSPEYLEDILCSVESVKGCLRATSDMSIYLQLVDVLLGCVQFDWKDQHNYYRAESSRAQAKRSVVNFVKSRLGIGHGSPFLLDNQTFKNWEEPSLFSVRNWDENEEKI